MTSIPAKAKSLAPPPKNPLRPTTEAMLEELSRWRALYPALTELQRRAFAAKYPEAFRERLASSTKARATLKNALSWLRELHPRRSRGSFGTTGLSPTTMALWIECTRELALAVETLDAPPDGGTEVTVEAARAEVNTLFANNRTRVTDAIGQNDTWKTQLETALASRRHAELDADGARLLRLADAIDAWLKGTTESDELIRAALEDEGVTRATVTACTDAAQALEHARSNTGPRATGHDTPTVNRAEGSVLAIMQLVWRKVTRSRSEGATSLVLRPDAATRRVIAPGLTKKKSKADADGEEVTEPPGTPSPTDPSAPPTTKVETTTRKPSKKRTKKR